MPVEERVLKNGRVAQILRLIYTWRLVLVDSDGNYEDGW